MTEHSAPQGEGLDPLTNADIDQIIEAIDHFVIGPIENARLLAIWQLYIDKLERLKSEVQPSSATISVFDPVNDVACPHCAEVCLFRGGGSKPGWRCTSCRVDMPVEQVAICANRCLEVQSSSAFHLLGTDNSDVLAWRDAALRLGEHLTDDGPNGYGSFAPMDWLNWAIGVVQKPKLQPASAAPPIDMDFEKIQRALALVGGCVTTLDVDGSDVFHTEAVDVVWQAVPKLLAALASLRAQITEACEACPSIRMQDHFDKSLLQLVNLEVARGFNRDSEVRRLASELARLRAEPTARDLHSVMMNIPCRVPKGLDDCDEHAYRLGHRDARHAAAELALPSPPAVPVDQKEKA